MSRSAPWDKFVAGDSTAISQDAIHGYKLFAGKAYCINCHSGPLFSDSKLHNIGVPRPAPSSTMAATTPSSRPSPTSSAATRSGATTPPPAPPKIATQPDYSTPARRPGRPTPTSGLFRTKHLRQIAHTGPYFHNGSSATLQDVMNLYNAGGGDGGVGMLDKAFQGHMPISDEEMAQVIEFLKTLTGDAVDPKLLMDTSAP